MRKARWFRKVSRRPDNSRNDIYYYELGKTKRLRSMRDIIKYCKINKLVYEDDLFSFQGRNTYEGEVKRDSVSQDSPNTSRNLDIDRDSEISNSEL